MSTAKYIRSILLIFTAMILSLLSASCTPDDSLDMGTGNPEDIVRFDAAVVALANTRGGTFYIEEGEVTQGRFGVLYKSLNQRYDSYSRETFEHGFVDFGFDEGPETGFAYYMKNGVPKDLKWTKVYGQGGSSVNFHLHNIQDPENHTWDNFGSTVTFKRNADGEYPYHFGPLDKEHGTNDLLGGSGQGTNKSGKIMVELVHSLSLLQVNIEVFSSTDDEFHVDLSNAEVTIDHILNDLSMYSVYQPSAFSPSDYNPVRGKPINDRTVTLVQPNSQELKWTDNSPEDGEVSPDYSDYVKKIYYTTEFVVPPQPVPYNSRTERPKLYVKVPKADVLGAPDAEGFVTYSGYLPEYMFDADVDGNIIGKTPKTLDFTSGYKMTITASINSPETELQFLPVKVETWVSKGEFSILPKQAGIYKDEQFYAMIDYYNKGDLSNLKRFGYIDADGNFVAQIWTDITVDPARIEGKMSPSSAAGIPDYYFVFNGYSVTLDGDGSSRTLTDSRGELELYNILSGSSLEFEGIQGREGLEMLKTILTGNDGPSLHEMKKYGTVSNADNTITFVVEGTFELNLRDWLRKIPGTYKGKTVVLTPSPSGKIDIVFDYSKGPVKFSTTAGGDADYLNKLVVAGTVGVDTEWQFDLLYDAYHKYYAEYPDILLPFGTLSNNKYTFTFTTSMAIPGDKVFLKWIPDPSNGLPDFTASIKSGASITVEDPTTPSIFNYTYNYIEKAMKGTGNANSSLTSLANYYSSCPKDNNYFGLWNMGRFENGKWIFPFTNTSETSVGYATIFGKLVPDPAAKKYDYEIILSPSNVKVTSVPVPNDSGGTTSQTFYFNLNGDNSEYPNDSEAFRKICDGTYWEYYEQWKQGRQNKRKH